MKHSRVLVVDDSPELADILRTFLERAEFDVTCAYGGAKGIQCALQNEFDIVLSDVMMPDVDGVEFLTKLKENKIRTRFIFITGVRTSLRDTVNFIKLGACDVIHKPIDSRELVSRLERTLALDSALSLHVSNPAPLVVNALAEAEALERRESKLALKETEQQWRTVIVRIIYFVLSAAVTVSFHRMGMIRGTLSPLVLLALLFVLLSLPFDRIKTFIAKLRGTEGRATFK
jgi:DNA-binding response OmpR family regulator